MHRLTFATLGVPDAAASTAFFTSFDLVTTRAGWLAHNWSDHTKLANLDQRAVLTAWAQTVERARRAIIWRDRRG